MADPKFFVDLQRRHVNEDPFIEERKKIHESWFNERTVDFWLHNKMYETVRPVAAFYRSGKWMTVGDGRYGLDSIRLKKIFSLSDILATDLGSQMLAMGKDRGLLDRYAVEDAERLSFPDNSFDVLFCKESFHHLPRPWLGVYEMIRVCKSAVILIEPLDCPTVKISKMAYFLSFPKSLFAKLRGQGALPNIVEINPPDHAFEESGNYMYSVSISEVEKLVHGLDLGGMAWLPYNIVYEKGCEFEEAVPENPTFQKILKETAAFDRNCKAHPAYFKYNMATFVIFKGAIDRGLRADMETFGFQFMKKVDNPITKRDR